MWKHELPVLMRYRYLLLLVSICTCVYILRSLNDVSHLQYLFKNPFSTSRHWHASYDIIDLQDDAFTIKTEGCTIPGLEPYDHSILEFIKPPELLPTCNPKFNYSFFKNISLLANNRTHIWIQKENLKQLDVPSDEINITCCYSSFYRPSLINNISSLYVDHRVKHKPCVFFTSYIYVTNEFVRVTCYYDDANIYIQYFLFARLNSFLYHTFEERKPRIGDDSSYNVLIMGLDSVSRLNFHRTMPKTLNYLKRKGAIELFGYNKVGDNTFPNFIPMLLGITEDDIQNTCWPYEKALFDSCPFIWDKFKDIGYYTALAEDSAWLGSFNYGKRGFAGTPTDYYLHPFICEAESVVGNTKKLNAYMCMGNKYFYQVFLDYVTDLTSVLRFYRLFGIFWEVSMTHDFLNYPMVMDESYELFLKTLEESKYLDNTILILMSDHGMRWGDIRLTKQGRLEEFLPLMQILLPQSFRENYTLAYNNLRLNSKRLTTPFDLFATLSDLTNLDDISNDQIMFRTKKNSVIGKSRSLFLPIPTNRTCKTAGIPDHWCTCNKGHELNVNSVEAKEAATHLILKLNNLMSKHTQCARLKLAEVIEVTQMDVGKPDHEEMGWREYMVVVRATPGGGVFEATLRCDDIAECTLTGTISRLNLYGDQSRCVHNYQLKLYCYCLSEVSSEIRRNAS